MMIAISFILFFGLVAAWLMAPQFAKAEVAAPAPVPAPAFALAESPA